MAEIEAALPAEAIAPNVRARLGDARIDAAHTLGDAIPDVGRAVAPESPLGNEAPCQQAQEHPAELAHGELLEQLRQQARQLARHLREVQADVDRRESQVNAGLASLDCERRGIRLWMIERQEELRLGAEVAAEVERSLKARSAQIQDAERQLEERRRSAAAKEQQDETKLDRRAASLDLHRQRLIRRRAILIRREQTAKEQHRKVSRRLRYRRQQLDASRADAQAAAENLLAANLTFRRQLDERERALDDREATWQRETRGQTSQAESCWQLLLAREERLAAAEAIVADQQAESFAQREELARERQRFQLRQAAEQAAAVEERRQAEGELTERREAVERAGEQVDRRRAALEHLQAELRELHRDSLESQLAAEELWGELQHAVPAVTLKTSLARLRGKLADHFRLVNEDLADQRQELAGLREQLAGQHERVAAQRRDVQSWFARRQTEVEQQAAGLCAREQELETQEQQLTELRGRWHREREGYRAEIRRLLAMSKSHDVAV